MEMFLVVAPAGNTLRCFDVEFHRVTSIWRSNSGQRDACWRDPLDHFSSERHSWRPPRCFRSNQPSSVIFQRASLRLASSRRFFWLVQNGAGDWALGSSERRQWRRLFVFAIRVRSWPCDAIVTRDSRIFHLSLAAWLAANGLCPAWFNPPPQSPECDNIWDDNSFTPSFTPPAVPYVAAA